MIDVLSLDVVGQDPVNVLLKEYLPGAKSVACNELQILAHLTGGLPNRKWHAAVEPMAAHPPIVPLLGTPVSHRSSSRMSLLACQASCICPLCTPSSLRCPIL